ncbi:hypothetical protein BH10PSE4_BH10PSE4_29440 [soil metagenome]
MSRKRIIGLVMGALLLLLLVIPIATVRIKIDLPPAPPPRPAQTWPVYVTLYTNGAIRVDGKASSLPTLVHDIAAQAATANRSQQALMVRTVGQVPRSKFMEVMKRLEAAGWLKIGVISDPAISD